MRTTRIAQIGMTLAAVALGGCFSAGTRSVTLLVTAEDRPVAHAHVRAIPINVSSMPLPLNSGTIGELGGVQTDSAFTDQDGRVVLALAGARTFSVEVEAPMLGADSELGSWQGVLDENGASLVSLGKPAADAAMRVELVR